MAEESIVTAPSFTPTARRQTLRESTGEEATINLTPLIDIIFILIFFFFMTTEIRRKDPVVDITLPQTSEGIVGSAQETRDYLIISISPIGDIFLDDEAEPTPVPELSQRLFDLRQDGRTQVVIRVDDTAPSGALVEVLGQTQKAGFERTDIPTEPHAEPKEGPSS